MNKKISLGLCISLIALAVAASFVITWTVSVSVYNTKIAGVDERGVINDKLKEIDTYVRNNYNGNISEINIVTGVLSGYLTGLGDPYAKYYTVEEYRRKQQKDNGKVITTGLTAEKEESGYIKVTSVIDGSSAQINKLAAGDAIISVGGVDVLTLGADNAVKALFGDEGTKVDIEYQRDGVKTKTTLTRESISSRSVTSKMIGDYGFLRVSEFNAVTSDKFETELNNVIKLGAKGIIVDLRRNGDTYYQPVKDIMDLLTKPAQMAVAEYKGGTTSNFVETVTPDSVDLPIVVLVDNDTAFAAELMACLLQDYKKAQLIGAKTAGKCALVSVQEFKDGTAAEIGIATIKSLTTGDFNGKGISPVYPVDYQGYDTDSLQNLAGLDVDLQVQKAVDVLNDLVNKT